MATECPHCFRTVIPLASGCCPNCRGNVKDPPSFGPGWGAVWVAEQTKLPEICCTCDAPCQRTVTISSTLNYTTREEARSQRDDDSDAARFIARLFLGKIFVMLYGLLTGGGGGDRSNSVLVKVKMRQCKPCSRNLPLEPQTVDYDYCKMRFVVSQQFVEGLQKGNV